MRILALFFLLVNFVLATQIQNIEIYDRNDRVDIMLSFDAAYEGIMGQKKDGNIVVISLEDLNSTQEKKEQLDSNLLKQLQITKADNKTFITLETKQDIVINPEIINNKFGLRIRILPQNNENANSPLQNSTTLKPSTSHSEEFSMFRYVAVVGVLILLSLLLWLTKRFLSKNTNEKDHLQIIFQKPLDKTNRFVILEYHNRRYTLILGAGNVLLDKEQIDEKHEKDESFDNLFEANKQKIQDLILKKQKEI